MDVPENVPQVSAQHSVAGRAATGTDYRIRGDRRLLAGALDAAAGRWSSDGDGASQRGQGELRVDLPGDRVADHLSAAGIKDRCEIAEARGDADVG